MLRGVRVVGEVRPLEGFGDEAHIGVTEGNVQVLFRKGEQLVLVNYSGKGDAEGIAREAAEIALGRL